MEKEVRFYYSLSEQDKIIKFLKNIENLNYGGEFYEKTIQYDHPSDKYTFYNKEIDGRFRLRISKGNNKNKAMITWKRRLNQFKDNSINTEEEVEVRINPEDYENQIILLENVLKMKRIESYERYRNIFQNEEIEIAIDNYPFGIAMEIESKVNDELGDQIIEKWLSILQLNINNSYKLSWDDKYRELCKEQDIKQQANLTFDIEVPKVNTIFK